MRMLAEIGNSAAPQQRHSFSFKPSPTSYHFIHLRKLLGSKSSSSACITEFNHSVKSLRIYPQWQTTPTPQIQTRPSCLLVRSLPPLRNEKDKIL